MFSEKAIMNLRFYNFILFLRLPALHSAHEEPAQMQ